MERQTGGERQVERQTETLLIPSVIFCSSTRRGFVLVVFTTEVEVTVVDRHISRNLHVAPGALRVVVRVTALVAGQSDFRDELLVLAEGRHLGR